MNAQRIMIIGCCGAGKSTLAKKLEAISGLELIHLDQQYWKSGWVETAPEEWKKKVEKLATQPSWIIDGNYGGTMDIRLKRADLIIYLDFPTPTCLWRILSRTFKYRGTPRPDMPPGCPERFDLEFFHYVATYNLIRRKSLYRKMDSAKKEKQVFILKNNTEVAGFLKQFEEGFQKKLNLGN